MDNTNFENVIGHDNFVWWIGVIEDRFDDGLAGGMRYKVRMFNSHTSDLNKIPTENLPWTIPLYSPNNTKTASAALEGDWAFGFYTDGMSKQAPVMIGVFPRFVQQDPVNQQKIGFTAQAKTYNSPSANTDPIPVQPTDAPATNLRRTGTSTIAPLSYTINGSVVEKADNNRAHVCDITNEIRLSSAINFIKNLALFQTERAIIEATSTAAASSPIATEIANAIKQLRSIVKMVQFSLKVLNKFINDILNILTYIRSMIAWILSLPAQLLSLLQQCLVELYNAVSNAVGFTISGAAGSEIITQVKGLYGDVISTVGTAIQTQSAAQAAVNSTSKLLDTKSYGKA